MLNTLTTFAVGNSHASTDIGTALGAIFIFMAVTALFSLAFSIFAIVVMWKLFSKMNEPGWVSIVPIYNTIVLMQKVGMNPIWILGIMVPILNLIIAIAVMIRLSQAFGKDSGFAIGLLLLSPIFMAILSFGDSTYDPSRIDRNSFAFLNGDEPSTNTNANANTAQTNSTNSGSNTDPWVNGDQA
jgi:hypothetical protein